MAILTQVFVEVYNTDTLVVVATSGPFDPTTATTDMVRLWAAEAVADLVPGESYLWRLRVHVEKTGSDNEGVTVGFGEPTLHFGATEMPSPYAPGVARWVPPELRTSQAGDSEYRLHIGSDGTNPAIEWGDGLNGSDVRIVRGGTRRLDVDSTGALPIQERHEGAIFERGPDLMALAITYDAPGKPNGVTRTDDGGAISTTVISYSGAQVASVVTTRFGKTLTVIPTYTGADITAIVRTVA